MKLLIISLLLFTATAVSTAQSPETAPRLPPQPECTAVIFNMVDCVPYLKTGSDVKNPDPLCCGALKELLNEDLRCACDALESSIAFGAHLNRDRASGLSSACGLDAPSISTCNINFDASGDNKPPPLPYNASSSGAGPAKLVPAPAPSNANAQTHASVIGAIAVSMFLLIFFVLA